MSNIEKMGESLIGLVDSVEVVGILTCLKKKTTKYVVFYLSW